MSSDSKAYIGGDPLPRPDISDRGERGTPIKPKVHHKRTAPKRTSASTAKPAPDPKPKTSSYRAPDNYSTYGQPGQRVNEMGPSSRPKTISLGKLPPISSTGKSDFASRFGGKGTVEEPSKLPSTFSTSGQTAGEAIEPAEPKKQSKHGYKVKWS